MVINSGKAETRYPINIENYSYKTKKTEKFRLTGIRFLSLKDKDVLRERNDLISPLIYI